MRFITRSNSRGIYSVTGGDPDTSHGYTAAHRPVHAWCYNNERVAGVWLDRDSKASRWFQKKNLGSDLYPGLNANGLIWTGRIEWRVQ